MRRALLPVVAGLFGLAAFVGAVLPSAALRGLVGLVGTDRMAAWVAGVLALITVGRDVLFQRTGRPRPLAVGRQVPRDWGHRHGPWLAALRYGVRMGFGPATILAAWTWWAAFVIAAFDSWTTVVAGAAAFVCTRTITTFGVTAGPRNGRAMAERSALLDRITRPTRWACLAMVASVAIAAIVGGR